MHINQICRQLKAVFSFSNLRKLAIESKFQQRSRCLSIEMLLKAAFKTLSIQQDANLSDIHQSLVNDIGCAIAYKPFHNQIRKPQLTKLLKLLAQQAMSTMSFSSIESTFFTQRGISRVLLQDGSSFALHDDLADFFAGRFNTVSPAAVELHMTYDLLCEQPCELDIRPDVEPERDFLPGSHTLNNTLLLADAGYFDLTYFKQVMENGGYFMVRANKTMNPTVLSAFIGGVDIGEKGMKLQPLLKKFGSEPIEMTVSWRTNGPEYRLLYTPDKNRPLLLLTNLSQADFHFDQLLDIYATRWQIELFFKELKSWNNLKGFMTRDPNIAESLIWLSLLLVFVKRFICHGASRLFKCAISTFKANKSAHRWLDNVLASFDLKSPQRKLKQALKTLATTCQRQQVKRGCKITRFCIGSESLCVA